MQINEADKSFFIYYYELLATKGNDHQCLRSIYQCLYTFRKHRRTRPVARRIRELYIGAIYKDTCRFWWITYSPKVEYVVIILKET